MSYAGISAVSLSHNSILVQIYPLLSTHFHYNRYHSIKFGPAEILCYNYPQFIKDLLYPCQLLICKPGIQYPRNISGCAFVPWSIILVSPMKKYSTCASSSCCMSEYNGYLGFTGSLGEILSHIYPPQ